MREERMKRNLSPEWMYYVVPIIGIGARWIMYSLCFYASYELFRRAIISDFDISIKEKPAIIIQNSVDDLLNQYDSDKNRALDRRELSNLTEGYNKK